MAGQKKKGKAVKHQSTPDLTDATNPATVDGVNSREGMRTQMKSKKVSKSLEIELNQLVAEIENTSKQKEDKSVSNRKVSQNLGEAKVLEMGESSRLSLGCPSGKVLNAARVQPGTAQRQLEWSKEAAKVNSGNKWGKFDINKYRLSSGKMQFVQPRQIESQNIAKIKGEYVQKEADYCLVSTIGCPLLADGCTIKKNRVQYARVLVEMKISEPVLDKIVFEDEKGNIRVHKVAVPKGSSNEIRNDDTMDQRKQVATNGVTGHEVHGSNISLDTKEATVVQSQPEIARKDATPSVTNVTIHKRVGIMESGFDPGPNSNV
ncbi:OLC1v1017563C1 [Oldenlandia corymbosa var. corymbosa]|uniref:OLC1v1017563C1 n=1 Tax=Oldenlandia corymbosa var. corymbosa TaxID=529605 RepID=A0AAV1E9S9_OLDCO|nr:OLC1v1017563C1 [Oldenlandia corymbosa var. corymbosa]